MKILMVGNDKSVHGGITTVIDQFKEYNWNEKNINFKFIPTYKEGSIVKKVFFFLRAYIKIINYCIFYKVDIIHIHMSYKGSFSRAYCIHKLCKILKIKDIIHLHGSEFKKWYDEKCNNKKKMKIRRLLKECNQIIVLGKEWKQRILNIEPQANAIIINNAITIPIAEAQFNQNSIYNILFLGVIIKRKGIYDLIDAIKILKEKKSLYNIKFIIAGTGEEEEKIKIKCNDLKINDYIQFKGWIDSIEKEKLLEKSQLLVLPSYNEGLPMAILEAMSYGLPIIATDVGDISEAVINGKNGFLVNPGDVNDLVNCILKMISLDQLEWKEYSSNSKKIINEKFSNKEYFKKIEKIYKNI